MAAETTLAYVAPSRLDSAGLGLATSGGRSDHPHFFRGFVTNAEQAARALLAVAEVSQSRYFDPGVWARMKDPVVTSNISVLRFESFSSCNGAYARFDLDSEGFEADWIDWGTTNVDLNEPARRSLASVAPGDPLRLTVGADALGVETLDAAHIENKVALPERWLRGFAETQITAATMRPVVELTGPRARAALRDLSRLKTSARAPWVAFAAAGPRATSVPSEDTPCLVGPQRLTTLARVARYATRLTVYAPVQRERRAMGGGATEGLALQASAWVAELEDARYTLVVSPELYRGFSGEGAVLSSLASVPEEDVHVVEALLAGQAALKPEALGAASHLPESRVRETLPLLGAAGRTGFDLASGAYFHRDLPYDRSVLADLQPRLRDAWELVEGRAVSPGDHGAWQVRSGDVSYRVVLDDEGGRCNCQWFAKHRGERGACKHLLAASLVASGEAAPVARAEASDVDR